MIKSYPKNKHEKLKPYKYNQLKRKVFERDDYTCQLCGNQNRDQLSFMHRIHKGVGGKNGPGDTLENTFCGCIYCHDNEERHLKGRRKK